MNSISWRINLYAARWKKKKEKEKKKAKKKKEKKMEEYK